MIYSRGISKISKKSLILSVYLFAFLFLALYGKQGFQTLNQIILWGFGPLMAFYILEPNIMRIPKIPKEYFLYLSMVLFAFLGYLNVINDAFFYRYLQVFIANFVLMIIVYFGVNNLKEWELVWKILGLVGIVVAIVGYFIETPVAPTDEFYRLEGITGNANGTANYARVAVIAGLILLQLIEKKIYKIMIWGTIIFLSYTILLTASRGSFANMVFLIGGYFAFKYFSGWRLIILLFLIFLFGNIILYFSEQFLSGFYLFERLTRNDSVADAIDTEARIQIYTKAWNLFLDNPLLGVGLNQFRIYSGGAISHTDLLDILVQLGIFAGAVYVSIYVKLFKKISRLKNYFTSKRDLNIYRILLLCFVSEIIFGVSNPNWFTQLQMIVLSLLLIYTTKIRNTNEPHSK